VTILPSFHPSTLPPFHPSILPFFPIFHSSILEEREDFRIRNAVISAVCTPIASSMKKLVISTLSAGRLIAHTAVGPETLEVEAS